MSTEEVGPRVVLNGRLSKLPPRAEKKSRSRIKVDGVVRKGRFFNNTGYRLNNCLVRIALEPPSIWSYCHGRGELFGYYPVFMYVYIFSGGGWSRQSWYPVWTPLFVHDGAAKIERTLVEALKYIEPRFRGGREFNWILERLFRKWHWREHNGCTHVRHLRDRQGTRRGRQAAEGGSFEIGDPPAHWEVLRDAQPS